MTKWYYIIRSFAGLTNWPCSTKMICCISANGFTVDGSICVCHVYSQWWWTWARGLRPQGLFVLLASRHIMSFWTKGRREESLSGLRLLFKLSCQLWGRFRATEQRLVYATVQSKLCSTTSLIGPRLDAFTQRQIAATNGFCDVWRHHHSRRH